MNFLERAFQIPSAVQRVADGPSTLRSLRADGGLIERALNETAADRVPGGPSSASYAEPWIEAIGHWLDRVFSRHPAVWSGVIHGLEILALILVSVAVGTLALAIWRLAGKRLRGRGIVEQGVRESGARDRIVARTGDEWMREIDRRLSGGDLAGALEALWWWLARSVGGSQVDESWTSRQLLVASGRADLGTEVGRLDRMIYGARRPGAEEIRGLFRRLAESVG